MYSKVRILVKASPFLFFLSLFSYCMSVFESFYDALMKYVCIRWPFLVIVLQRRTIYFHFQYDQFVSALVQNENHIGKSTNNKAKSKSSPHRGKRYVVRVGKNP